MVIMATTLLNIPSTPSTVTDNSSDPGTPASGISTLSTVAIKDGHEGHHPQTSFEIAAERVARLGGIGSPSSMHSDGRPVTPTKDYFGATTSQFIPETPRADPPPWYNPSAVLSKASVTATDGISTPDGEGPDGNSTALKREAMAKSIDESQAEAIWAAQRDSVDNPPPFPTASHYPLSAIYYYPGAPKTGGSPADVSTTVPPPHFQTTTAIAPAVSPLPRISNANSLLDGPGSGGIVTRNTDSPASTQTTSSVAEAKSTAKMIDGMTYDEGDTTAEDLPSGRRDTLKPGDYTGGVVLDEDTKMED